MVVQVAHSLGHEATSALVFGLGDSPVLQVVEREGLVFSITPSAIAWRIMRCQALSRADQVSGMPDSETRRGRCSGLIGMDRPKSDMHNLTGKPTDLMRLLVRICEQGGRILDPFAGSGTTLVAVDAEGYNWTGIDMTRRYYDVASSRLGSH